MGWLHAAFIACKIRVPSFVFFLPPNDYYASFRIVTFSGTKAKYIAILRRRLYRPPRLAALHDLRQRDAELIPEPLSLLFALAAVWRDAKALVGHLQKDIVGVREVFHHDGLDQGVFLHCGNEIRHGTNLVRLLPESARIAGARSCSVLCDGGNVVAGKAC